MIRRFLVALQAAYAAFIESWRAYGVGPEVVAPLAQAPALSSPLPFLAAAEARIEYPDRAEDVDPVVDAARPDRTRFVVYWTTRSGRSVKAADTWRGGRAAAAYREGKRRPEVLRCAIYRDGKLWESWAEVGA